MATFNWTANDIVQALTEHAKNHYGVNIDAEDVRVLVDEVSTATFRVTALGYIQEKDTDG